MINTSFLYYKPLNIHLKAYKNLSQHLESELLKMKRENKAIRQQIELMTAAHDQLKVRRPDLFIL